MTCLLLSHCHLPPAGDRAEWNCSGSACRSQWFWGLIFCLPVWVVSSVASAQSIPAAAESHQITLELVDDDGLEESVPTTSSIDQEVQQWIERLASPRFAERQRATNELWEMGPKRTAAALLQLRDSPDLELRQRAEAIIHRFRIGLIPSLDPALARQILTFETGTASQRLSCIDRLLEQGHVRSALALVRSIDTEGNESWFDSIFYNPDQYVLQWIQTGQWQAVETFLTDPDIVLRHPYFSARYLMAMGQDQVWLERLQPLVDGLPSDKFSTSKDADDSLRRLLNGPELTREAATRLAACLHHRRNDLKLALQQLEAIPGTGSERFRLAFASQDYQLAATLCQQLDDQANRRFVLPEEDVARQLTSALLTGWGGDRQQMRQQLKEIPANAEQGYTVACALAATADPALMERLITETPAADPASTFDFFSDLQRWDQAFEAIEYPVDGPLEEQQAWLETRLIPMRESPEEYRRGSDRSLLLSLAEALDGLGHKTMCRQILTGLATIPTSDEGEADFALVQLCRRAVEFGQYQWALELHAKNFEQFGEASSVAIWFPEHSKSEFWFRQLPKWEPQLDCSAATSPEEKVRRLRSLVALIGRLTRTAGIQSMQPERFMDPAEVDHYFQRTRELARKGEYNQTQAREAGIQLLWDYQQWQQLQDIPADERKGLLETDVLVKLAIADWQLGHQDSARQQFWQIYRDHPEAMYCLVLAALPDDYDIFQYTPDLEGRDLSERDLLTLFRPWDMSPESLAETMTEISSQVDPSKTSATGNGATGVSPGPALDLMMQARLHYALRPLQPFARNELATFFRDMGADQLAAWQTLEFKENAIWQDVEQRAVYAANYMLSHTYQNAPELSKLWRCEVIAKSLLNYPIGKVGLYASFGLAVRTADLKIALRSDRIDQANQIANQILDFHPYEIDVVEQLTAYHDGRGSHTTADQIFQRSFQNLAQAQQRFPKSALFANNLAWMCVQGHRNLEQAEALVRTAIQLEPGVSNYPDTLADVLWLKGQADLALDMNRLSQQLAPTRAYYRRQAEKLRNPVPARK